MARGKTIKTTIDGVEYTALCDDNSHLNASELGINKNAEFIYLNDENNRFGEVFSLYKDDDSSNPEFISRDKKTYFISRCFLAYYGMPTADIGYGDINSNTINNNMETTIHLKDNMDLIIEYIDVRRKDNDGKFSNSNFFWEFLFKDLKQNFPG